MNQQLSLTVTQLQTQKNDLGRTRAVATSLPAATRDGTVILRLDRFALTSNNITYAAFGDAMNYWGYFPTGNDEWGHMPVWGFAEVISSDVPGVATGERFYGYFPIASHVVMSPVRVTERGFYDGAAHRQDLVSAYNQYQRCSTDAAYEPRREAMQMLYRPLFLTSWMLDDFLRDNGWFGSEQIVISSASAKTAYGAAFCMARDGSPERIALTSARNRAFVERLGLYDRTVDYETLAAATDPDTPTLYIDFSGDSGLRDQMHRHFGAMLAHDCYVGSTQNHAFLAETPIAGPKPAFFFTPNQLRKRNAEWGGTEVTRRYNVVQAAFFDRMSESNPPLLTIVGANGFDAAAHLVAEFASGRIDPAIGNVVELA